MNALIASTLLIGGAVAETVHGVVVFTRHGDRTTKHYGSQVLTPLGASQNFAVGGSYRERYLDADSDHQIRGISPDEYVRSQVYASAPNQGILSNTATAFLQGLYPPLEGLDPELATTTLNDDSESTAPLDGYQYVFLNGVGDESEDTIWIKGDDACPAYKTSSASFTDSEVFADRVEDTRDFYAGFWEHLEDVYDLTKDDLNYANAYSIFDLVNVARIHNTSSSTVDISDSDFARLRTLADSQEFGLNYNASEPARAVGARTLSGAVLSQLNQTVATEGKLKFSLLAGSYDTFLAFFGVTGLAERSDNFTGLPAYAGSMAFELFTETDGDDEWPAEEDLRVRWLFKNGTDSEMTTYPLFGQEEEVLSYTDFKREMADIAISDVSTWCDICSATVEFCAAYADEDGEASDNSEDDGNKGGSGGISNAVAGVIGAVVTLFVVAVVGGAAFLVMRRKNKQGGVEMVTETRNAEKRSIGGSSA